VNNSDERDYAEEAANQRLMDEEHEEDDRLERDIIDNMLESNHCDVCGRLLSTHIICDGPDNIDNPRDLDEWPGIEYFRTS
jgi:hypothetical protein